MSLGVHVDDVVAQLVGSLGAVRSLAPQVARYFRGGFQALGLEMASKSRIVATSKSLAAAVIKDLGSDFPISFAQSARDLGLDCNLSGGRACPILTQRLKEPARRGKRLRIIVNVNKKARTLLSTNVKPSSFWGHQMGGVAFCLRPCKGGAE